MIYELYPVNGRKSFYGKATIEEDENGVKTLYSYGTPVIKRYPDGKLERLWFGWSYTIGNHIYAFCGIRKKDFDKLSEEK